MKQIWIKWVAIFTICLIVLPLGTNVFADDDDEHNGDDEKYEYYQETNDEGEEDDGDPRTEQKNQVTIQQQPDYWNIWSREARNNSNNDLPTTEPGELTVLINNQQTSIYFIPQDGQLLVSGEAIAKALGGEAKFFPQSKICVLTRADHELIVRAGFNVAYENQVKTPIPTVAQAYEKTVYLPVSVAANALGYRVSYDTNNNALVFQAF